MAFPGIGIDSERTCEVARSVVVFDPTVVVKPILRDSRLGVLTDARFDDTRGGMWLAGAQGTGLIGRDHSLTNTNEIKPPQYQGSTTGNVVWVRGSGQDDWKLLTIEEPGWGQEGVAFYSLDLALRGGSPQWHWKLPDQTANPIGLVQPLRMDDGTLRIAACREFSDDVFVLSDSGELLQKITWGYSAIETFLRSGKLGEPSQMLIMSRKGSLVVLDAAGRVAWTETLRPEKQDVLSIEPIGHSETEQQHEFLIIGTSQQKQGDWQRHASIVAINTPPTSKSIKMRSIPIADVDQLRHLRGMIQVRLIDKGEPYSVRCTLADKIDFAKPIGRYAALEIRNSQGTLVKECQLEDGETTGNPMFRPRLFRWPHAVGNGEDFIIAWGTVLYLVTANEGVAPTPRSP